MRYKMWESFASGVKEEIGLVLLVLAGPYLGENLDEVACYTDGMLTEDRLCIRLDLFVQSSEVRTGSVNLLQAARGKKVFRQESGLFVCVYFSSLICFPFISWIHPSFSTMLICKGNSLGSSVQWQQRLFLGHSHQWSRLVIADSKWSTGLFSWWISLCTKQRRYLILYPKEKCLCVIVCGIFFFPKVSH